VHDDDIISPNSALGVQPARVVPEPIGHRCVISDARRRGKSSTRPALHESKNEAETKHEQVGSGRIRSGKRRRKSDDDEEEVMITFIIMHLLFPTSLSVVFCRQMAVADKSKAEQPNVHANDFTQSRRKQ